MCAAPPSDAADCHCIPPRHATFDFQLNRHWASDNFRSGCRIATEFPYVVCVLPSQFAAPLWSQVRRDGAWFEGPGASILRFVAQAEQLQLDTPGAFEGRSWQTKVPEGH